MSFSLLTSKLMKEYLPYTNWDMNLGSQSGTQHIGPSDTSSKCTCSEVQVQVHVHVLHVVETVIA